MTDSVQIDGHQVTFEPGTGWRCACTEFVQTKNCDHVVKAAALRTLRLAAAKRGTGQVQ
jgi:hypothetical protein